MKRVAVCFYGEVRWDRFFNEYYPHTFTPDDEIKYTGFLATWDSYTPTSELIKKSVVYNYKKTTSDWDEGNTQKVAYLVNQVIKLKSEYEIENNFAFDAVILMRPDVVFHHPHFKQKLLEFTNTEWSSPTVMCSDIVRAENNHLQLDSDWMFLMTSEAADIHSSLYNFFYLQRKYKYSKESYREGGHWIHLYYFRYNNFLILGETIRSLLTRPVRDKEKILEYLKSSELFYIMKSFISKWDSSNNEVYNTVEGEKLIKARITE